MTETYCGKSCQECGYRAETGCRGCREQASLECKLAHCCREKGHESCQSCTFHTQCGMYKGKDTAPQFRVAKKKAELEHQEFLKQRGAFLSKWIWVLFWLFIPTNIASVMIQWVPALEVPGYILDFGCSVVYGVILLKIASQEAGYRWAGVLVLVTSVLDTGIQFIPYEGLIVAVTVASAVLSIFSCYYEFNAHADVLEGLDNDLSEQWRKLWKWMMGAVIAMVIGVIFAVVILGLLVMAAAAIAILVISILKLVYLYRTAQNFQDVAAN